MPIHSRLRLSDQATTELQKVTDAVNSNGPRMILEFCTAERICHLSVCRKGVPFPALSRMQYCMRWYSYAATGAENR